VRYALPFVALILVGSLLSGCAGGPQGIPPLTLEHAQQLQAQYPNDPDKVVAEYTAIKNDADRRDPNLAAEALFASAQFTSDPARYGTAAQVHATDSTTPAAREAMEEKRAQGDQLAREALKQLVRSYPNSPLVRSDPNSQAVAPATALLAVVDKKIDQRNSKMFSYKVIDGLVALTGRNPAFSYWFALVLIAVFIKVVTFPLMLKTYKSQREMQKMQPILKEIQTRYKDDPQETYKKTQEAYKEHGVNPFASCLPSLVQLPIFFWMINMIRVYEVHLSKGHFLWVGSALSHRFPDIIAPNLGQLDIPILLLYAASMYISMKLTPATDPQMAQQQQSMSIMMTGMMIYYFLISRWSSAFLLYYLVQNILSSVQTYHYVYKPRMNGPGDDGPPTLVVRSSQTGPAQPAPASGLVAPTRPGRPTAGGAPPRPRPKRKGRR
jgi:YidC/Oxa1 family membrane protein insertase